MTSQDNEETNNFIEDNEETNNFLKDIINYVLTKWDSMPSKMKLQARRELMSVFISFVGNLDGNLDDKRVIGIHLC